MKKTLSLLFLLLVMAKFTFATHNRAGEITYKHIQGLRYEITITTYTDPEMRPADRPSLQIFWGDEQAGGDPTTINRVNGDGEIIAPGIKKNYYRATHTYPGPGRYIISMEDPNRVQGVMNITGSVNIPFYIQSELIISPFGGGANNSPVLLNAPIDNACINKLFIHNPGATDPDGDQLVYRLTSVLGAGGAPVPGFIPSNVRVDSLTGDLIWNSPDVQGIFNFAIEITEIRNGDVVGRVLRDLQVFVGFCENDPPEIMQLRDTCVEAGTFLQYAITATDPNPADIVTLTATGGPFVVANSPATFTSVSSMGTVNGTFNWQTQCSHVRANPYLVYIRAADTPSPVSVSLSDYKSFNVTVVGPSPKNPSADPTGNDIVLNWDRSICEEVTGYRIYRRTGLYGFTPANCEIGVPAYTGYAFLSAVAGGGTTTFTDRDLIHGQKYCYMIVAVFPGNVPGYASIEVCAELKADVPIITNVSVEETAANGKNYIAWAPPKELELDQHPGPYKYRIYHSEGLTGNNFQLIDSTAISTEMNDTVYIHNNVNTSANGNSYRIDLVNAATNNYYIIGSTHNASSVLLAVNSAASGKALNLIWEANVPWSNFRYDIFRYNETTETFDSIATTNNRSYQDTGLVEGNSYCYYIKSVGDYSVENLISPIINLSQRQCGIPQDIDPPCPPITIVNPDCELEQNVITWTLPQNLTYCDNDAQRYRLYYATFLYSEFSLIENFEGPQPQTFIHTMQNNIAGCYYVSALDQNNNESAMTDTVCVDNCPVYELPNVFSPDGDFINDFFKPFPYKFVESVDLKVFNRWGQIVFETNNPNINWNGVNATSGVASTEGVYFYVCIVNERRLEGIIPRTLTGFVHLFRNANVIPQPQN
jgi:gliding motility-associated-like protein